jgi:hypothetical protein
VSSLRQLGRACGSLSLTTKIRKRSWFILGKPLDEGHTYPKFNICAQYFGKIFFYRLILSVKNLIPLPKT